MTDADKVVRAGLAIIALCVAGFITFWGTAGYIALHFIAKLW